MIIALMLVGYDMIIVNSMVHASLAIHHLKSSLHSWNNRKLFAGFIKRARSPWESTQFRAIVVMLYMVSGCTFWYNEAKILLIE